MSGRYGALRVLRRDRARRLARPGGDRGSITLMLAALGVALIALAGIVIDGGVKLRANQKADAVAQEAARAGAGMVDQSTAYSTGAFIVDRAQAIAEARAYLAAGGFDGQVTAQGTRAIRVTVEIIEPTRVLSIIGIDSVKSAGSATASLVTGVTGPGA